MPIAKILLLASAAAAISATLIAQTPATPTPRPSYQDRLASLVHPSPGAWTTDQLATMARLRDAAIHDTYALDSRFYFNYHHTPADTFDKVDPRELSENAAVMTVLSYALADSPAPVPR